MNSMDRDKTVRIGNKEIGGDNPCFVIAEMSGNHNQDYGRAEALIRAAKEAGADAVKLQTYTADTITLNSSREMFMTEEGGLWAGRTLYDLYQEAYTPWEWQPRLKALADDIGILLFSSPFDVTAVDFLEKMDVPAYKIASFEITDVELLSRVARTGKPIIMSTGIADLADIELAIRTCKEVGNDQIVLLKCTSAYPAPYSEMNLRMIPNMKETFGCCVGLSDHSLDDEVAVAAVALGADVVEKHFTLRRSDGGVDSGFSMEAEEMKRMVERIRHVEAALGRVSYDLTEAQRRERRFGRSLFACRDIVEGETFTNENIRSVRPADGLPVKYLDTLLGKKAARRIPFATPLSFPDVAWNGS